MYIDRIAVYDILEKVEHCLVFPSLGIGQIDIEWVKVGLGLEHDKAES